MLSYRVFAEDVAVGAVQQVNDNVYLAKKASIVQDTLTSLRNRRREGGREGGRKGGREEEGERERGEGREGKGGREGGRMVGREEEGERE